MILGFTFGHVNLLFYIWAAAAVYLILFYTLVHSRLAFYRPKAKVPFSEPLSVVICARNEAANLRKNLPKILSQKNAHYEVVVVNDRSTDQTAEVLQRFKMQYPNLQVVESHAERPGKKSALLKGLESAKHSYFLLTDADCEPTTNQWLASMAANFSKKSVVLGFSPYKVTKGFISRLVQWETLLTAQNYLSMARAGLPYMGVGRNLGYSKAFFESSDRFASHSDLASGDDDLMIGQVAKRSNTTIEIAEETFTWSSAPEDLKTWWRQKRRHLSTSYRYKPVISMLLGLFGLSQLMFYTFVWPLLFLYWNNFTFEGLLLGKFVVQALVLFPAAYKLRQQRALLLFPLWEMLVTLFLALIHLQNKLGGSPRKWN